MAFYGPFCLDNFSKLCWETLAYACSRFIYVVNLSKRKNIIDG